MDPKITADNVRLKRAYEPSAADDGTRILIDRLWPRGVKKVDAAIDQWAKDIAPSTELRKWFGHDPARWLEFCNRYWLCEKSFRAMMPLLNRRGLGWLDLWKARIGGS